MSTVSSPPPLESAAPPPTSKDPVNILICPAQFCVPVDYTDLIEKLTSLPHVSSAKVADLPRTEWIKVARQLPTAAFFRGELDVRQTLGWYFDGIESSISELYNESDGEGNLCIIGHSIGGWVARAYLGGRSGSATAVHRLAMERVSSFITLGTPHYNAPSALVDQTRGLLDAITSDPACSAETLIAGRGIDVTCVGSTSVASKLFSKNLDELIATSSYFPLTGKWSTEGDGIVPKELAFMESPARRVELDDKVNTIRHAHVLPTPWNVLDGYEGSIKLEGDLGRWYGSDDILEKWVGYIK